jgi:formate hydrogenlyase transcriptional activator
MMSAASRSLDVSNYFTDTLSTSLFEGIAGSSEAICRVTEQVMKVAPSDATVLVTGESGTGKELIARAIHKRSRRAQSTFARLNCAAIPPSLIASELFGYERGAFTGAHQRHAGRFEVANHGTIFLDEVGDMPSETQVALLRVLQEGEFELLTCVSSRLQTAICGLPFNPGNFAWISFIA